ncbi:MAG: pyridoxal-dependent decarboxylase, partial [Promethearchaeota archaeon]
MEKSKYKEYMERVLTFFPTPSKNRIMDGYFIFTISHFLDHLDDLKTEVPIFGGVRRNIDELYKNALQATMPSEMSNMEDITYNIIEYCEGMYNWSHQHSQLNVIGPPPISGIVAKIAACIMNANLVSDEYSHRFALAEVEAVSMLSNLVGYDSAKSGGVFTFGGTGTNLYAMKIGLEKCSPGTFHHGVHEPVKVFASDCAHYTKYTCLQWLGIGSDNLILLPTSLDNDMDLGRLEEQMREVLDEGNKIACITATQGTTDAFGIDDLEGIVNIRDRLEREYDLDYSPHVHADAVIGWIWSVFNDYDFGRNEMGFKERTLKSLKVTSTLIRNLRLADSIGIDFHKTGYAPYISSLVILKDRNDLNLISREKSSMPYL